ncbi:condensation domain-containing protein [Streptomyces collinus]|uniref:condensation domain-containing protein n=1 Tax=Streptomyces collinus TaxID=42684 RepID=UPI0033B7C2C0
MPHNDDTPPPEPRYASFTGARSADAHLTWGQQEIWALIEKAIPHDDAYTITGSLPLPDDLRLTETQCLDAVSFFLSRHESLRTVFPRSGDGSLRQVVLREGRLPVQVVHTDLDGVAGQSGVLRESFAARPFDYHRELPVRLALVVAQGRVRSVVYAFSHLAVDWYGLLHLLDEVERYLRHGENLPPESTLMTPVGLAHWQVSPEGVAKRDRTLRHVESLFGDRAPLALPPAVGGSAAGERYVQARLRSQAAHAAAGRIARGTGVSTSAVLLGATALLLRDLTGSTHVDLHLTSSQRFDQRTRTMVATLMQESYFSVDVDGVDLREAVRRSWRSALTAYQNAGCDKAGMDDLLARLGQGPRDPLCMYYCVNDRRTRPESAPLGEGDDADLDRLLGKTVLTWPEVTEQEPFYLVVDSDGQHLDLSLTCDVRHFPATTVEQFLRGLERSMVHLAGALA